MSRYQIVFSGQLVHGASREQVQANLAKLFRADAARIAALFSGRRVSLKGNLAAEEAETYRTTLERAGALADILPMEAAVLLAPGQETDPPANRPESPRKPLVVAPRDLYMAAFSAVEAPDFGVAPAGADLQVAEARSAAAASGPERSEPGPGRQRHGTGSGAAGRPAARYLPSAPGNPLIRRRLHLGRTGACNVSLVRHRIHPMPGMGNGGVTSVLNS